MKICVDKGLQGYDFQKFNSKSDFFLMDLVLYQKFMSPIVRHED